MPSQKWFGRPLTLSTSATVTLPPATCGTWRIPTEKTRVVLSGLPLRPAPAFYVDSTDGPQDGSIISWQTQYVSQSGSDAGMGVSQMLYIPLWKRSLVLAMTLCGKTLCFIWGDWLPTSALTWRSQHVSAWALTLKSRGTAPTAG